MRNNFLQEIIVSIALIILLLFFLNPFGFWMPTVLLMMMVLGLVVVFAVFASFVWRENVKDEREDLHRMLAGRFAFLVGAGALVIGIVIKSLNHSVDSWLVFTLGAMLLAKISGLIYSRLEH